MARIHVDSFYASLKVEHYRKLVQDLPHNTLPSNKTAFQNFRSKKIQRKKRPDSFSKPLPPRSTSIELIVPLDKVPSISVRRN